MVGNNGFKWRPIDNLPEDWQSIASPELRSLATVWEEQKLELEQNESLQEFNEQLIREWSIETGIIERVYTLSRGITQLLIERGIEASLIPHGSTDQDPELVVAMIRDHKEVAEGLFDFVRGQRDLSTSYIKELQAALTRHQSSIVGIDQFGKRIQVPLIHGEYKKLPNNPVRTSGAIHEYCPPEQVTSEMDNLIAMHRKHEQLPIPPEVESAWLHHRFTQIHPFQDGNGRVARCLATLVFLKAGWLPLVITNDDRTRYIGALERADGGDLNNLVSLFVAIQKKAFIGALGVARDVHQKQQVSQVIDAVQARLAQKRKELQDRWENAKPILLALQQSAKGRLDDVGAELLSKLGNLGGRLAVFVDDEPPGGNRGHYFRFQIVETARTLGYFANQREYVAWTRLVIRLGEAQSEILLSYHAVGQDYRGILAASACFFARTEAGDDNREIVDLTPLADEIFQVNYAEVLEPARQRFQVWLESVLTLGLETWRQKM